MFFIGSFCFPIPSRSIEILSRISSYSFILLFAKRKSKNFFSFLGWVFLYQEKYHKNTFNFFLRASVSIRMPHNRKSEGEDGKRMFMGFSIRENTQNIPERTEGVFGGLLQVFRVFEKVFEGIFEGILEV